MFLKTQPTQLRVEFVHEGMKSGINFHMMEATADSWLWDPLG